MTEKTIKKEKKEKNAQKRIDKALNLIGEYYTIDGEHHKNWTVVEAVKILYGNNKKYQEFVDSFDTNEDGEKPTGEDEVYNSWKKMLKNNCIAP